MVDKLSFSSIEILINNPSSPSDSTLFVISAGLFSVLENSTNSSDVKFFPNHEENEECLTLGRFIFNWLVFGAFKLWLHVLCSTKQSDVMFLPLPVESAVSLCSLLKGTLRGTALVRIILLIHFGKFNFYFNVE